MTLPITLAEAYALMVIFASASVIIASLELLTLHREFADRGLFGWDILRAGSALTLSATAEKYRPALSHPLFVPLLAGSRALAAAGAIVFVADARACSALVIWMVLASIALYWRTQVGLDGSDQMSAIVLAVVAIHLMFRSDAVVAEASLWFVAAQGCLAYFAAGAAKLISPAWRSGEAVRRIFNTRTYGSRAAGALLVGRPGLCVALAWMVIVFECLFPLALLLGTPGFVIFAAIGVTFHVINAVVMGLNTFLWSFLACYPAILFCAGRIHLR